MDRLDAMKVLVDEGSLAAAGRELGRSPAAVSRAIAFLEERAGCSSNPRFSTGSQPLQSYHEETPAHRGKGWGPGHRILPSGMSDERTGSYSKRKLM
jgi:hypothetical protein